MKVVVAVLSGRTETFDVEPATLVEDLRERIERRTGWDVAQQELQLPTVVASSVHRAAPPVRLDLRFSVFSLEFTLRHHLLRANPAHRSVGVPMNSDITLQFSTRVHCSSAERAIAVIKRGTAVPEPVPGSSHFDPVLNVLTFRPREPLARFTPFRVYLRGMHFALRKADGSELDPTGEAARRRDRLKTERGKAWALVPDHPTLSDFVIDFETGGNPIRVRVQPPLLEDTTPGFHFERANRLLGLGVKSTPSSRPATAAPSTGVEAAAEVAALLTKEFDDESAERAAEALEPIPVELPTGAKTFDEFKRQVLRAYLPRFEALFCARLAREEHERREAFERSRELAAQSSHALVRRVRLREGPPPIEHPEHHPFRDARLPTFDECRVLVVRGTDTSTLLNLKDVARLGWDELLTIEFPHWHPFGPRSFVGLPAAVAATKRRAQRKRESLFSVRLRDPTPVAEAPSGVAEEVRDPDAPPSLAELLAMPVARAPAQLAGAGGDGEEGGDEA